MKKCIFIIFALLNVSLLNAETQLLVYPPSFAQFVSGKHVLYNSFREGTLDTIRQDTFSKESGYTMYNFPIEIRKTIIEISDYYFMGSGGLSFYFEDGNLSSINISAGITFGSIINRNGVFLNRLHVTLYPLYEFPMTFLWKTAKFPWKFTVDFGCEIIRIGSINLTAYTRVVCFFTSDTVSGFMGFPDVGLAVGWIF
ncbi:MAG: hypothetical protein FWD28_05140 [Treponema sp.]|nr:hypothetical protein [Treponema sp.]